MAAISKISFDADATCKSWIVPVFEMIACNTTVPLSCAIFATSGYVGGTNEILLPAITPPAIRAGPMDALAAVGGPD